MKFIDLFAGIGGFHLGMEQAGHECVGWVEWDKFARKSYQAIHDVKGVWNASDIRTVRASEIPRSDCWCFGFPCQDISVAGKQGGFTSGRRSSLFFTVTGLLRGIQKEDRPAYLLIENVKNLLSINNGWDFAKLQVELDEIGYDVEWDVLDSAEVVPQHRERIFIVGHLRGRRTRKVFPISRKNGETNKTIKEVARMNLKRHQSEGNSVLATDGISQTISATAAKHPMKVAINSDKNTVKKVGNIRPNGISQSGNVYATSGLSRTLTAVDYKDPVKVVVKQLGNISDSDSFGGNPQTGRVYSVDGVSPTLSTMQGGGREPKIAIPVSSPDRIKKRQNGRRFKTNGEPEFTLTGQDRHGVLIRNIKKYAYKVRPNAHPVISITPMGNIRGHKQDYKKTGLSELQFTNPKNASSTVTTSHCPKTWDKNLRIRKLTPLECWRLQGFPDWAFDRAKAAGLSDSQLYKQAGNSVTVPVIKAIADRMALIDETR